MLLKTERDFYEGYQWALSPFLSFEQIIKRLNALSNEKLNAELEWCRKEWNINLYMLSAAAADIMDDYLVRGVFSFSKIADYFSFLSKPVQLSKDFSLLTSKLRGGLQDGRLRKWQQQWSEWMIQVCQPLVMDQIPGSQEQKDFQHELIPLLNYAFPKRLLAMRARIPAAYRSQDLTHHDFISLSQKYSEKHDDKERPHVVIGLRTAGSYFAPVVGAYLKKEGYKQVSFLTMRPKSYIPCWEEIQIKKHVQSNARFIVVDEPPGTGKTLTRCVEILKDLGVNRELITLLVPIHPAGRDWLDASLKYSLSHSEIITLEPEEWHKEKLLSPRAFGRMVSPYFKQLGFEEIEIKENDETEKINEVLKQNPGGEYHVRLKRVYQVTPKNNSDQHNSFLVMGKSVGWGWLGYHAALIANHLADFVPNVYGVHNGIMYLEWVNGCKEINAGRKKPSEANLQTLSAYISQRTNQLRLAENPTPFLSSYRESGLQSIAIILSKVFGSKLAILKRGWVRKRLEKLPCPVPTLLDAKMMKGEWINSENGLIKADFEHHGFSKTASHNIVDPAYDLAAAMFEFELADREKDELMQRYIQATGDETVHQRLFYFKLLYGSEAMGEVMDKFNKLEYRPLYHELNRRFVRAWNFLVSETTRHLAGYCAGEPVACWKTPLFVMDIDDVLDKNIFGFPSTTQNGVLAISLLRAHDIPGVVNTARSLDEVKDYCRHYGLVGGIAEYGSVIWDAVEQKTDMLVSAKALAELAVLREELSHLPGTFINPFYTYSIRAYHYDRQKTLPVPEATISELFGRLGIKHLKAHRTHIDTAILDSAVDKGKALLRLKELKGINQGRIAAVGDSEADLPMLIVADQGFLLNNSSVELKRNARHFGITIVPASFQAGLLEAVKLFLHGSNGKKCQHDRMVMKNGKPHKDLMRELIQIADQAPYRTWLKVFDKNIFEVFQE